MSRVGKAFGLATLSAALCCLVFSAPAGAAVVSGSNLSAMPNSGACFTPSVPVTCTYAVSTLPTTSTAGGGARAGIDGVITSWSVKSFLGTTDFPIRLRVIRGNTAVGSGQPETLPTAAGTHTFKASLPVRAGDEIGMDMTNPGIIFSVPVTRSFAPGATTDIWTPALGEGETRVPSSDEASELELMVNATIEPDVDHDGYGDETQDTCPTAATNGGPCPPPPPAEPVPDTSIAKGPKGKIDTAKASFRFRSTVAGSSFQCRLDKKPFKACKSPKTYKGLAKGKHTFRVRAIGPTGLVDATPAKRTFKVKP